MPAGSCGRWLMASPIVETVRGLYTLQMKVTKGPVSRRGYLSVIPGGCAVRQLTEI